MAVRRSAFQTRVWAFPPKTSRMFSTGSSVWTGHARASSRAARVWDWPSANPLPRPTVAASIPKAGLDRGRAYWSTFRSTEKAEPRRHNADEVPIPSRLAVGTTAVQSGLRKTRSAPHSQRGQADQGQQRSTRRGNDVDLEIAIERAEAAMESCLSKQF